MSDSSCDFGGACRQNGHLYWRRFPSTSRIWLAHTQPLQIILLQHAIMVEYFPSNDSGKQQIGQSPRWLLSGCLNKSSSRNSAARFLHSFLCFRRWSFWHLTLQYRADLQAVHVFSLMSSPSAMPQEGQHIISAAADFKLFVPLMSISADATLLLRWLLLLHNCAICGWRPPSAERASRGGIFIAWCVIGDWWVMKPAKIDHAIYLPQKNLRGAPPSDRQQNNYHHNIIVWEYIKPIIQSLDPFFT